MDKVDSPKSTARLTRLLMKMIYVLYVFGRQFVEIQNQSIVLAENGHTDVIHRHDCVDWQNVICVRSSELSSQRISHVIADWHVTWISIIGCVMSMILQNACEENFDGMMTGPIRGGSLPQRTRLFCLTEFNLRLVRRNNRNCRLSRFFLAFHTTSFQPQSVPREIWRCLLKGVSLFFTLSQSPSSVRPSALCISLCVLDVSLFARKCAKAFPIASLPLWKTEFNGRMPNKQTVRSANL